MGDNTGTGKALRRLVITGVVEREVKTDFVHHSCVDREFRVEGVSEILTGTDAIQNKMGARPEGE